jgi:hypothetical protein
MGRVGRVRLGGLVAGMAGWLERGLAPGDLSGDAGIGSAQVLAQLQKNIARRGVDKG